MKIKTKNKDWKKRSQTMMGLFIIATLLLSTLAYVTNMAPQKTIDDKVITTQDGKIYLKENDYYIDMQYYPSSVQGFHTEDIDLSNENLELAYYSESNNPTNELPFIKKLRDSQAKFAILGKNINLGCDGNCSFTKIDCNIDQNIIVIKESSSNNYYKKNYCNVLETTNFNKTVDYLIYKSAKVLE